ncbi:MAG: glycine cleavage system protein GcvH [Planctomycetaceae bacterium]|jgi:glycine cleavage system H protein
MDPETLYFAKTHEWVSVTGNVATVGITDFAVRLLTDIVYLSLPVAGKVYRPGQAMGEVESVKAVSDIYAPVSGEVLEVNSGLPDQLQLLSESPFERAWIVKLKLSDASELEKLMNRAQYLQHCGG